MRSRHIKTLVAQQTDPALKEDGVVRFEPLQTLNKFMVLHQLLLSSFSENLERQHSIGLNEFRVLMAIGGLGETASHEIAEETGMPIMAISRTAAALEKRQLIERSIDKNNRRRKPITLTKQGEILFSKMLPSSLLVAEYVFDSLRLDESLAFDHHLQTMIDRLSLKDDDGELLFVKETKG